MSQCISTDWVMSGCCFSFGVVCLGSAFPSFLPSRFQPCLSLVSWANRQRRGAGGAPGLHQTHTRYCSRKTVRNREALLGSVTVYHQKKKKKTDLERAVLHTVDGGVRQVGSGVSQQFSLLFVSVLFCSALSKLGVQGREKMRISGLMSSGNSILIHL